MSRRMRRTEHVARIGEMRNAYKILNGKSERKSPRERPRHKWEDNIRIAPRGIVWEDVDWIKLAQDRVQWRTLVNTIMNLRVP
jgi:hypothetical protein